MSNNNTNATNNNNNYNHHMSRPKSHLDWVGNSSGGGGTGGVLGVGAAVQGNMSMVHNANPYLGHGILHGGTGAMAFSNMHEQSNYGSTYGGGGQTFKGGDSFFFMDHVEMYNVKYNPKASTHSSGLQYDSSNRK